MAEEYGATDLVAAFESTMEALRRWPAPATSSRHLTGEGRAWLCHFGGVTTTVPKGPPSPAGADETPAPYDRVALVVTDHGAVHLFSFSTGDEEPAGPPGSEPLATGGATGHRPSSEPPGRTSGRTAGWSSSAGSRHRRAPRTPTARCPPSPLAPTALPSTRSMPAPGAGRPSAPTKPSPDEGHAVVLLGERLFVWGGAWWDGRLSADGWLRRPPMP